MGNKQQVQWIGLALDRESREVIGVAIGDRTAETTCQLWASLPAEYRMSAVCYTDFWKAYAAILL